MSKKIFLKSMLVTLAILLLLGGGGIFGAWIYNKRQEPVEAEGFLPLPDAMTLSFVGENECVTRELSDEQAQAIIAAHDQIKASCLRIDFGPYAVKYKQLADAHDSITLCYDRVRIHNAMFRPLKSEHTMRWNDIEYDKMILIPEGENIHVYTSLNGYVTLRGVFVFSPADVQSFCDVVSRVKAEVRGG